MSPIVKHLRALDRALVARGFPAMSPWWRTTIERFYAANRRQLVLRVGRRGGKSSTLCRVGVVEALYGEHVIPPGDVGVVAIVSVSRDEAAQRLRTVRAILDALGVKYRPVDSGVELVDRPIVFKTFTASISGVSGFTCIVAICDEVAKWRDSDSGANPATEVLASLRPTMATQPRARIILSSSPFGREDAHAGAFDQGDTDFQITAYAPTWIANPSIAEDETHRLEPDDRVWRREYLAEPQAGTSAAFNPTDVARLDRAVDGAALVATPIALCDSSAGGGDAWTGGAAAWHVDASGKRFLFVFGLWAIDGAFRAATTSEAIVNTIASNAKEAGARIVVGDQFQSYFLESALAKRGLSYVTQKWINETKTQAVARLRAWMRDGTLVLQPGAEADRMKRELLAFEERTNAGGYMTYGARRSGHDDRVALLLNAAMAEVAHTLPEREAESFNRDIDAFQHAMASGNPRDVDDWGDARPPAGPGGTVNDWPNPTPWR